MIHAGQHLSSTGLPAVLEVAFQLVEMCKVSGRVHTINAILIAVADSESREVHRHNGFGIRPNQESRAEERRSRLDQLNAIRRFRKDTS